MTRDVVEAIAARDAIEVQTERGRCVETIVQIVERRFQVLARALGVAQHETDRVAELGLERDGDYAMLLAGADDIAHDKLPALDRGRVLVHRNRNEDVGERAAEIGGQRSGGLGEDFVGRTAVELEYDVVARGGHAMRRADKPACDSVRQREVELS